MLREKIQGYVDKTITRHDCYESGKTLNMIIESERSMSIKVKGVGRLFKPAQVLLYKRLKGAGAFIEV